MLRRLRGHYIWPAPLGRDSIVIDAGAHRGEFSAAVIEQFHAKAYLIEANPALAAELNVPGASGVMSAALAATDGRLEFQPDENPEAGGVMHAGTAVNNASPVGQVSSTTIDAVSLPTLMRRWALDRVDLLKLDIEGAEFDLIDTTPDEVLRSIGQVTCEFHDFLPVFARRGLFEKARARMESLGFLCCVMSFRTHGDVLFVNLERHPMTMLQSLYAANVARWIEKTRILLER